MGHIFNLHITEILDELASQMQLVYAIEGTRSDIFRIRNIKKASTLVGSLPEMQTVADLRHLRGRAGVGDGVLRRVAEILRTGALSEIDQKYAQYRTLVSEIGKIHGIGVRQLKKLYDMNITSIEGLRKGVSDNSITLPFVSKVALRYAAPVHIDPLGGQPLIGTIPRIPRALIKQMEQYLRDNVPTTFQICGSFRRGEETSGDIDVLLMRSETMPTLGPLITELMEHEFLVAQLTSGVDSYHGICQYGGRYCRIDFLMTSEKAYYPALLHFTGSGIMNRIMRYRADKIGLKLSNLGLFCRETNESIHCPSEEFIFEALGMKYLSPKDRSKGK